MPARTAARRDHMHAAAGGARPQRARLLAPAAVCLGFFVILLDVTIVNVALPTIQHDIGGSVAGLQWVVDSYTLALASVMLTAGSMADRRGARRVYLIGLAGFAAGSAACALAPSLGALIAARAVQGLGASALLPCSLALIVHRFPDQRERARALGVWGGMGALGFALGPVLGGALISLFGWRAIFLVNLPVCVLTGGLLARYVPESPRDPGRRTDVPGLLLGVAALAAITAAFIEAGQEGWFAPLPVMLGAAGIAATAFFLVTERRRASPMLPLGLFRSRALSAGTAVGLLFNLSLYGSLHLAVPAAVAARVRRRDGAAHPADERGGGSRLARERPANRPLRPAATDDRRARPGGSRSRADRHGQCDHPPGRAAGGFPGPRHVLARHAGHDRRGRWRGRAPARGRGQRRAQQPARPAGHWASRCSARCWQRPVAAPRSRSR